MSHSIAAVPHVDYLEARVDELLAERSVLLDALREITDRYEALDRRLVDGQHDEDNGTVRRARHALAMVEGRP